MSPRHAATFGVGTMAMATIVAASAAAGAAAPPDTAHALELAQRYLARWQEQLSAVVAEEHYRQTVRTSNDRLTWRLRDTRQLRSDVLLVKAPADRRWLCFRDVVAVDGTPVSDRQERFDALFTGPAAGILGDAKRIAEESARHNLGFFRTVNTPVAGLIYLAMPFAAATTWELAVNQRLADARVWTLKFEQSKAPFVVHEVGKKPVASSGRIWIEPGSGRILRTEFVVHVLGRPRVITDFAHVAAVDTWAPVRMEERFEHQFERIAGLATYTKHRAFRTAGRIIG
jgi:hypothetical protein